MKAGGTDGAADPPSVIEERGRVVAAFSKAASEHGYRGLDMDRVARYAGITPERCREYFRTPGQGLVAAQDAFLERLWDEVTGACEAAASWPEGVRSALHVVLEIVVEASPLARVFMVEATAASMAAAERQYAFLGRLTNLLGRGRIYLPQVSALPPVTERVLVGGVASILGEHLLAEEPAALAGLEAQLVENLLVPYLGPVEARRQARGQS